MNPLPVCDIALFVFLDLIPNLTLALLPFRDCLRFSKPVRILLAFLLYLLVVLSRITALYRSDASTVLSVIWIILYLVFYRLVVKAPAAKLLYVLFVILNYGSFMAIIFSYFVYHRFPFSEYRAYSLPSNMILALMVLISYPLMYRIIGRRMKELVQSPESSHYWRVLWLVPATFCLSYYYNLSVNGGAISFSADFSNVLFAVFFNLGAVFVNYLIMGLLMEINTNLQLKTENHQLNMQTLQYENLKTRMEDARRAKHDLRQTLAVIQTGLQRQNYESLLTYLQDYISTLPCESPIAYCENYAANALIVYYANMAVKHGISFKAAVSYPSSAAIADADFVVLMGNLLENAIEACLRQAAGASCIFLNIAVHSGMLVILLDNSYDHTISKKNGSFISSKTGREGIGTASIQKIVSKYGGVLKTTCKDGNFSVSIMINPTRKGE